MVKTGVLLINLGTPDDSDPKSVRRYLTEFLNDPRVIDLPIWLRWPLVNLLIVPFRYKKTAAAYQQIWQEYASPLLLNSQNLQEALQNELGSSYQVELAMRYGKPSMAHAMEKLKNCGHLHVIPLFPQYTSAATGSALENFFKVASRAWNIPNITIINDFYADKNYIDAYSEIMKEHLHNNAVDHVLFSFHGLPERHLTKSACTAVCDHLHACPRMSADNLYCYRAQCYATTACLVENLNLSQSEYTVSFQSRLGRTPWIQPYTDLLLPEMAQKGIQNIAIVCPSFVADCLETLEEINIRARAQWQALGGKKFVFIPCINSSSFWVQGLTRMIKQSS